MSDAYVPLAFTYDKQGRITGLNRRWTPNDGLEMKGDSVCMKCGKNMPGIWEAVCSRCLMAHCHKDSRAIDGFWACVDCRTPEEVAD